MQHVQTTLIFSIAMLYTEMFMLFVQSVTQNNFIGHGAKLTLLWRLNMRNGYGIDFLLWCIFGQRAGSEWTPL